MEDIYKITVENRRRILTVLFFNITIMLIGYLLIISFLGASLADISALLIFLIPLLTFYIIPFSSLYYNYLKWNKNTKMHVDMDKHTIEIEDGDASSSFTFSQIKQIFISLNRLAISRF